MAVQIRVLRYDEGIWNTVGYSGLENRTQKEVVALQTIILNTNIAFSAGFEAISESLPNLACEERIQIHTAVASKISFYFCNL